MIAEKPSVGAAIGKVLGASSRKDGYLEGYLSAHLGGEQQMGAQIINNDIDLMIFLRDPVSPHAYESEVNSILHLCDMHNIPLATNLATAEVLLLALDRGDLDWRNVMR